MTSIPPPIDPELKKILACPRCQNSKLTWNADGNAIDCETCQLRYEIQDGIPVMLVEQAKPLAPRVIP